MAELAPLLAEPLKLPALTRDGEPIEVFDQLPPLPEPYTARAEPLAISSAPERPPASGRRRAVVLAVSSAVAPAGQY